MTDSVVSMDNVNMFYGDWHALRDVSLNVAAGEVVGLLGHNGAGKTTTIRLLNGLLKPTSGNVRVLGVDPLVGGAAFRTQTSVVNDSLGLPDRQTARQALAFHAQLFGLNADEAREHGEELLIRFGLGSAADVKIMNYSRGMRQRLALARSMLHKPRLLLLDEPTLGMDPVGRKEFRNILKALTLEGTAVLMSTHDLGEVERACDNIAILHQGEVVLDGNPDQAVANFMRNVEVTIDVETNGANFVNTLQTLTEIDNVHCEQNTLHLVAADRSAIGKAVKALTDAGASVVGVKSNTPSLEDVYISMHDEDRK